MKLADIVTGLDLEIKSGHVSLLPSWDDIKKFLKEHLIDLLILIGTLVSILVAYAVFLSIMNKLKKKGSKYLESDWILNKFEKMILSAARSRSDLHLSIF